VTRRADLAGQRVAILGIGRDTISFVEALRGVDCTLVAIEERETPAIDGVHLVRALDEIGPVDFVVRSPGFSPYRADVQEQFDRTAMLTPTAIWLAERDDARPTAAVTGTKGKSSTVSLVEAALTRAGVGAIACGNIGVPIWDVDPATPSVVALEVSSYQTLDLTSGPPLRALTSLSPDHVDWHGSIEQYYRDKLQLFAVDSGSSARMLAPASDATAVEHTKQFPMTYVNPASDARASAPHRRRNAALAAHIVAEFVPGANPADLEIEMLADYPDLPGRLRPVGRVDDVEYVDDALASNPLGTAAAVAAYADRRIVLIVGGADRGLAMDALVDALDAHTRRDNVVVYFGAAGERIGDALRASEQVGEVIRAHDLTEAVGVAAAHANPFDVVIFSPAAPSEPPLRWPQRSALFQRAVHGLEG
jgi:UDP-N-acetylmuramoyl-L-alanine---L-glutamate ligase